MLLDKLLSKIDAAGFDATQEKGQAALVFWDHVELHVANSAQEKALCHLLKSEVHATLNQQSRIADELNLALGLLQLPEHIELIYEIKQQLFKVHYMHNQFEECLRDVESLQQIALEYGNIDQYVTSVLGMGMLCTTLDHYPQALKFFKHIDLLDAAIDSRELRLRYKLHKVTCLIELKQFSDASTLLKECKELSILVNDKSLKATLYYFKSRLYRTQNRFELAQHRLGQAISFSRDQQDMWLHSMVTLEASQQFYIRGRKDLAELFLSSAARRESSMASLPLSRSLNHQLSQMFAEQQRYQLALECQKRAYQCDIDLIKALPLSELGTAQLDRLARNESKLRLIVSEQENKELKAETQTHKSQVARLQQDVYTDPLTQLHNRRWLDVKLKDLLLNATPFALLVIDIDHFKSINDELSHLVGDKAITSVASELKNHFRFKGSSCIRFGGEEFLVILEHTGEQKAQLHADHFRQRIAQFDWQNVLGERALTVSIGVTLHKDSENTQRTFYRADKALYEAKALGRNQVCVEL